jgi:hypothetical protein
MHEYNDDRSDRSRIEAKLPDTDKIQKVRATCRERVFSAPTMEYERGKRFAKMELDGRAICNQ